MVFIIMKMKGWGYIRLLLSVLVSMNFLFGENFINDIGGFLLLMRVFK